MLLLISCSIRPQGWALVASGCPRQLTFGPGQLKKVFWSPSCALSPLCSIRLWGKSGNWLLHFYLVDKIRKKKEKYSFAQYVVKLFTFEDLKVTVMFHSTWFHMNPNYNNYCSIVPFTSHVLNCTDIAKIRVEHWDFPWDDQCLIYFSVSMDLESVAWLSLFQTKILSICKFPVSQLCL